ncbi:capsular exopolysaccharide family [Cnuella takakiae]|uniref:Capsular exopolysaccharide family n=1 Tax=Cnuella takakiae TaxID=1302690 RepID=A0A1M5E1H5_9BACT|nr:tyrosine-protein kinase [Cnuella takakiae]OLY93807.1 hypothetical protein BUE76_19415 [Cnuella takakiae]SHF72922.1 capsular exopolysaccharide family [Cnuella takakiae]
MQTQEPKQYSGIQDRDDNLLQDMLAKYLPYWPLFLVLLLMSTAAAWTYLRYKNPAYLASATVLIKDENKGIWDQSEILQSMNLFGASKIVENEIEVIRSRTLAKEVARNLKLYAPTTVEGKFNDRSAYTTAPITIEHKDPEHLKEWDKVYFTFDSSSASVAIDGKKYSLNTWHQTPYGVLQFRRNKYYAGASGVQKPLYFSLVDLRTAAGNMLNNLSVNATSKQSSVLNLEIQDEEPVRGEDMLNELIAAYERAAINDKNVLAANTLKFVQERLHYVVKELDSVEQQLERFRTQNKIVDISSQGKMFLDNVGANDQRLTEVTMQLSVLDQVERYVLSKNNKEGIVPATLGVTDPVLTQLLQRLYEAEMQYERLRKTTAENHPMMVSLAEQIDKIRPGILENVRSQRNNLEAGRSDVYAASNKFNSILYSLPEKERELLSISRQQAIKNNIYTFLLQKREETALSFASTVSDSRLVDVAQSFPKPVSPVPKMVYLMAIVAAIGAGIGFVTIKEVLNRNIMFRTEIEQLSAVPILGEVAYSSDKNPLVVGEGKRTIQAEQFRHLRTSLGYLGINSRKKKILITSSISGEGKSFVTANLGISLALMGKKVVMLELDLRKPRLASLLGVARLTGVTNFLISEKDAEEIIKPTAINTNLFVVPSGPIPPNPSELIGNGQLGELFAYLEQHFDYILVDTAPISPVTDAYILSPMCDATLYMVRHGYTPRMFVRKLDEQIRMNGLNNMAIIFNGVKNRGYGNYGYGYGHAYGNGYAYNEEGDKQPKRKKLVG